MTIDVLRDRLSALTSTTARHVVLPLRPATVAYPLAWLDRDADDTWDSYPELDDVADELGAYVPLADADLGDDEHRCLMVARDAPHAVYVFDDGFQLVTASLEAFSRGLLGPGESPAPPPVAEAAPSLDAVLAAGRWLDARPLVEAELATWKSPDDLTTLRASYARILAELGDRTAADKLVAEHVDYLRWLSTSDRPKALAIQEQFGALLAAMHVTGPATQLLAVIRSGVGAELAPPPPPGELSADDIATAVRLVSQTKTLPLRSLLKRLPELVDVAEVNAAFAALPPDSPKKADIEKMFDNARTELLLR